MWLYNPKRKKGISPKFSRPWEGPYLVTEPINDLLYRIQKSPHAKEKVVHRNQLWKYQGDNFTSWLEPTTTPSSEAHTNHSVGNQPAPQPGKGEMTRTPRAKEGTLSDAQADEETPTPRRSKRNRRRPDRYGQWSSGTYDDLEEGVV